MSAVAQRAKAEACPPSRVMRKMVGTAQERLCPPYGDPQPLARASGSLHDLIEFLAEQPGQA
ncbi:MAG: hypothetical protein ABW172_18685, partial [Candidatus Binatia bacterium]